jgi:hypothetical protein
MVPLPGEWETHPSSRTDHDDHVALGRGSDVSGAILAPVGAE